MRTSPEKFIITTFRDDQKLYDDQDEKYDAADDVVSTDDKETKGIYDFPRVAGEEDPM